jgi:hypothetical protein
MTQNKTVLPFYIRCIALTRYVASICITVLHNYRALREILGAKRDEVTGECRKLHNVELNDLYCSPDITQSDQIEKNEMGGACSAYGGEEGRVEGFGGEN